MSNETGFPSPAQGYEAKSIDLNTLLIKNKAATFFMKYRGGDLQRFGILPGTLLIIDRSLHPAEKDIVVFACEGEFRCGIWCTEERDGHVGKNDDSRKTQKKNRGSDSTKNISLYSGNRYIPISEDICIFGVVTCCIRSVHKQ